MIDEVHEFVKKHGYVRTMQGFKRNLQTIYSKDKSKKNEALRQSVNTIIQGTGAFLTNRSLVYIKRFILNNGYRSRVIATVHDSILLDCPKEEIDIMAKAVPYIMNNLPIDFLKIDWKGKIVNYPVGTEAEIGENYNDMIEYNEDEFHSFKSVKGYVQYNYALEDVQNHFDNDMITQEQYDQAKSLVESKKADFQSLA